MILRYTDFTIFFLNFILIYLYNRYFNRVYEFNEIRLTL